MGCHNLTYQKNNLEVTKNYFRKELTSKRSSKIGYSNLLFGSSMPGRSFSPKNYRFGFNGMEKSELEGDYTTDFRMLDTRLGGRWWSTDPIVKPWESPYAGFSNNPIVFSDPSGLNPGDKKESTTPISDLPKNEEGTPTAEVGEVKVIRKKTPIYEPLPERDAFPQDGIKEESADIKPIETFTDYKTHYTPKELKYAMDNLHFVHSGMGKAIFNSPYISHYEKSRFLMYNSQREQWENIPHIFDLLPNTADEILTSLSFMTISFAPYIRGGFRTINYRGNTLTIYYQVEIKAGTAMSRSSHRLLGNNTIFKSKFVLQKISKVRGLNMQTHMSSGKNGIKSLLNPKGMQWHHQFENGRDMLWLLSKEQHNSGLFRNFLHPGGSGGWILMLNR